ncbi:hypothetical protein ACFSC3_02110 [Sphingomonas floccifaciens]|uniref:Uncharacterized protein n=1 Tax=Sphingomonas floccifaciens TaxID=1844115 RepID=A0ABW4N878_9SPHN
MIEDDGEGVGDAPFARSYDSFKHMTGIALLSLGGVFAFFDGDGMRFARGQVIIILAFFMLALVTSVLMVGHLASLEVKPEPREKTARHIRGASIIVGVTMCGGLGGFTYNFMAALFK